MSLNSVSGIAVLCGVAGIILYLNTLDCGLCYDDLPAIIENQDLRPNESWTRLLTNDFWGTPMERNNSHKSYRPLCVATFKLNYLLHELEPMGYHLVNILLHGVVCYLYVQLCGLVLSGVWPALIAGLLFAVHPIHTEAVASVVGRADCLSGVFFLLAILCYHRATRVNEVSRWLLLTLLCCLCASLSKETGLTVLAVCFTYDLCFVNQVNMLTIRKLLQAKTFRLSPRLRGLTVRLLSLTVFGLVFTLVRLKINNGLPTFGLHDNPAIYLPSPWRQLNWLHLCFVNMWLILNPFSLSCDWRSGAVPAIKTITDPWNVATALTLVSVMGLGLYSVSGRIGNGRNVVFGLSLMVFPYLPASNLFFPVGFVVAERVLYLPSMGLCLLVAHGVWHVLQSAQMKHTKVLLHSALLWLLLSHTMKTYQRNRDWLSNEQLFSSAVRVFPENGLMLNNVGQELVKRGNMTSALSAFRSAVSVAPHIALLYLSLAKALKDVHEYEEAEQYFNKAVELVQEEQSAELAANIYCDYGNLLTRDSNLHNRSALLYALSLWKAAHRLQPEDIKHVHNKGFALLKLGRYPEAREALESVLSRSPDHFGANYKLGEVLLGLGLVSDAERRFRAVLKINGSDVLTKFQLAGIVMKDGSLERLKEAEQLLLEVIEVEPLNDNAQFALGVVHYNQQQLPAAEQVFRHTLTVNPAHTSALYNLGLMYVHAKRYTEAMEVLSQLIDLQPLHVQGLTQIAACHAYQSDLTTAVVFYQRALDGSNGHPDWNLLSNYGIVLRELGEYKKSEELLVSALGLENVNKKVVTEELRKTRSLLATAS